MVETAVPPRQQVLATRRRVARKLDAAREALSEWSSLVRQSAEARVGSAESEAVIDDPAYWDAMVLYSQVADSVQQFTRTAARIEAGERA